MELLSFIYAHVPTTAINNSSVAPISFFIKNSIGERNLIYPMELDLQIKVVAIFIILMIFYIYFKNQKSQKEANKKC